MARIFDKNGLYGVKCTVRGKKLSRIIGDKEQAEEMLKFVQEKVTNEEMEARIIDLYNKKDPRLNEAQRYAVKNLLKPSLDILESAYYIQIANIFRDIKNKMLNIRESDEEDKSDDE